MTYLFGRQRGYPGSITKFGCANAILLSMATATRAIDIVGQNSTAPAGGTGSFDVNCLGTADPADVDGFSIEITVPTDITITSTSVDTADPYIFGSLQSPPFVQSMTSNSITVGDAFSNFFSFTSVIEPDAFGLVDVDYSVAPGTLAGIYAVDYPMTTFDYANGVIGEFGFPNPSTITVTVPEPATLTMVPLAGTALLSRRRGRRP
jgi:hypothetical protein